MSNIKERILQIPENKGVSKESFFENIGMTYGNFKGEAKKTPINSDAIANILSKHPDISLEWLVLGIGPMLKKNIPLPTMPNEYSVTTVRKLKTDRKTQLQSVPLYDLKATAGIVDLFDETNRSKHIPISYITIPNLPKCDGAIPITGDSMYPLLKSGDMVLYREVHDKKNIIWGEMYLVAISHHGDDFFFAKYIQKSEQEGYIKLVSQNINHQPVEFPIDSITALALIKASIRINTQF